MTALLNNEVLCIQDLKLALDVQSDSLRAKSVHVISLAPLCKFASPTAFYHYVILIMTQDAAKRRFLAIIFLVSNEYIKVHVFELRRMI